MTKKEIKRIIAEIFEKLGSQITSDIADKIKSIGFQYATFSGVSIGYDDMVIPQKKHDIILRSSETVKHIINRYWKGWITAEERHRNVVRVWADAKKEVADAMKKEYKQNNHIYMMVESGARGDWGQVTQLSGMKGLVANPSGRTIELPITSNLKEGFSILEYFNATHGGRKGKSDTALKTSEAGYLTRRLVDSVQDIVIREHDCGSAEGTTITREESIKIGESFESRILGRTLSQNIIDKKTGEVVAEQGSYINNKIIAELKKRNINEVQTFSILTCRTENGICQKCYGLDLGCNEPVQIGTPVGIIAAQSIGEPGTQLTMRTFHMGGVAEGSDITQGLTRVEELFEARNPKTPAHMAEIDGTVSIKKKREFTEVTIKSNSLGTDNYTLYGDFVSTVKVGNHIKQKQIIARSKTDKAVIRANNSGIVEECSHHRIAIRHDVKQERAYKIPPRITLVVKDKDVVRAGEPLTVGHLDLKMLMDVKGILAVQSYIMTEVQHIYASQGQTINDKHIEIIVKQMLSKVRVLDPGNSPFLPGEITNYMRYETINESLRKEGKRVAYGERLLLGITKISLYTDSWLSAASFQETIRVLVEASINKKVDYLDGLKENVIIGRLIPAGNVYREHHDF